MTDFAWTPLSFIFFGFRQDTSLFLYVSNIYSFSSALKFSFLLQSEAYIETNIVSGEKDEWRKFICICKVWDKINEVYNKMNSIQLKVNILEWDFFIGVEKR